MQTEASLIVHVFQESAKGTQTGVGTQFAYAASKLI